MDMTSGNKKLSGGILLAISLAIAAAVFFANDHRLRGQSYEGVIQEAYRTRNWLRGFRRPLEHAAYRYYRHYWRIEEPDGSIRQVYIPHFLWKQGTSGTPVKKTVGERYPQINTPKASEDREIMNRFF